MPCWFNSNLFVIMVWHKDGFLLDACIPIKKVLQLLHDTMMPANVIPAKRDFLSQQAFWFKNSTWHSSPTYLWKVDLSASLVPEVYTTAQTTAKTMLNVSTPSADRFSESLCFDTNGNLCSENILLNHQHWQTHQETLTDIKKKLCNLKLSVLKNLECNIKDQCSDDSTF